MCQIGTTIKLTNVRQKYELQGDKPRHLTQVRTLLNQDSHMPVKNLTSYNIKT
jgi:hypothetical protein